MKWKLEHYKMAEVKKVTLEEMIAKFKEKPTSVVFEKVNGESRMIRGTLNPDFIPTNIKEDKEYVTSDSDKKPTALAIWEIEPGQWRSFRLESMYKFDGHKAEYAGE